MAMLRQWQSYHSLSALPPAPLVPWLRDPGSFMQRLRGHGIAAPGVRVISQQWQYPCAEECKLLGIASRHYALIREVVIASHEGKWMFARTVIPRTTLTGREKLLAGLKTRALGTMLFNKPGVTRSPFEFNVLTPATIWHKRISEHADLKVADLWARRSIFHIKHKSLLLTEVFFPDLMEW